MAAQLVPIELTFVVHREDDLLGKALAAISLLPIALLVSFVTLLLFRRDLTTAAFFAGQLANEVLNAVLKRLIKEPRPQAAARNDYGMPSSHAQFMAFFAIYSILILYTTVHWKQSIFKHIISIGIIVAAALVAISRVYLNYHSEEQVVVGLAIGALVAPLFFSIVRFVLRPYVFPFILQHPLGELLLLRDLSDVDNILLLEYETIQAYKKPKVSSQKTEAKSKRS